MEFAGGTEEEKKLILLAYKDSNYGTYQLSLFTKY